MKNSELNEDYLDEKTFWHITSKLNIESIRRNGLVPHDGKRNGKITSAEDPVPRVFFSQGLEGVLGQANNLAFLINEFVKSIERTNEGDDGRDIKEKMQEFLNNSVNGKEDQNGGFIDIVNFIKDDIFKNGINKDLSEQDLNKIVYNIVKTIWENDVCLKVNLEEDVDYSWNDINYSATGNEKVQMTKRNMHAFEGHSISPDIIEIITDQKGKSKTTWDVFKEMSAFYRKKYPDKKHLPVEEWQSGYMDENGETVYTGEIHYEKDYLSMFFEMERSENVGLRDVAKRFAGDKNVALKKEVAKKAFGELEKENANEQTYDGPTLSE